MDRASNPAPIAQHAQMLSEALQEGQQLVLEQMAAGDRLDAVLNTLCALVEMHAPGVIATLTLYDEGAKCLRFGAAPALPASFAAAVDGSSADAAGSLAARAILRRANVVAEDLSADEGLMRAMSPHLAFGLVSGVAVPILGPDKTVLGAFNIYKHAVGPFDPMHVELVQKITSVASVAIRNDRREQTLERSQAALREAQRIGRFGNWSYDLDVRRFEWSEELFRLYERDPALGPPTLEEALAYYASDDSVALALLFDSARTRPQRAELDLRVLLPSGREAFHHAILSPVVVEGRGIRLVGTMQDVSERVHAELAVRETEEAYRQLVEHAPDAIVLYDAEAGRFIDFNPRAEELFGATREELKGLGPVALSPFQQPDARDSREAVEEYMRQAIEGGAPAYEWTFQTIDGRPIECEVRFVRLPSTDRVLLRGSIMDISERKRSEEALRQAQKLESLGLLAGGIAHDFNNLLSAILGNVNLLQLKVGADAPTAKFLNNIEQTVLRAADLTRQMLAYSGKGRVKVEPISLNELVNEMIQLLSVSISKHVKIDLELEDSLLRVDADQAQMQQVIMNLVTNASDAIGDREGRIRVRTGNEYFGADDLRALMPNQDLLPGDYVRLEVLDTGSGMSQETMSRIFDPFFTTKRQGRGLGLSAMQGILRSHRAGIRITSEVGRGTRFELYFPASAADRVAPRPPRREATPAVTHFEGLALVVDDEPGIRAALSAMLRHLGFDVIEASDGIEAIEKFERDADLIRVVLLDLTMPRLDGRAVYSRIRALRAEVPVILCSGYGEPEAVRPLFDDRRAAFLQKPYQIDALRRTLLDRLGRTTPSKGIRVN